ncbi:transcriptional regulator, partial [Burkholderia pseudomallei]|nr:transcriptional regulator [Burkholderia pseudomallei]
RFASARKYASSAGVGIAGEQPCRDTTSAPHAFAARAGWANGRPRSHCDASSAGGDAKPAAAKKPARRGA